MTYVLQAAEDPSAKLDEGLLTSLHLMMLRHDLGKHPGHWRPGPIYVRRKETGEIVYEGPDVDLVPGSIAATLTQIDDDSVPPEGAGRAGAPNRVMILPSAMRDNGRERRERRGTDKPGAREAKPSKITAPVCWRRSMAEREYLRRRPPR